MRIPTILTALTDPAHVPATIAAAGALALAQDAHLDILALGVDRAVEAYATVGATPLIWEAMHDRTEAEARAVAKAAEKALAALPAGLRAEIETNVVQLGALADLVASRARFADLVVLPRPYGKDRGPEDEACVEAALFGAGVPVIVLPETPATSPASLAPKHILLAWNQSREALAAARRAMPFLKAADSVTITVIDPPSHGPERSDPGGALCQWLARHGVKAEVKVLARTLPRVSDTLVRQARETGADMIVMGAYGHSRLREAILGGATRAMLEGAAVPVLMAH